MTRSFSWVPRFACTRPLWCPFCYMLQKPGQYFHVTKKSWRHSTWSANAKSCTYTGLSMSQTQRYPLVPAYHLLYGLHQKTSFVSIRPHSSAHSGDSSTQRPTLPSWPSIWSFTWQGLETSSCPSSRSLDRPTPQRHWICSCQPLETGHPTGPWWSDAMAWAGCAMTTTTTTTTTTVSTLYAGIVHLVLFHNSLRTAARLTTAAHTRRWQ